MVKSYRDLPLGPALRRSRARSRAVVVKGRGSERGAAMFIVVMVVTVLAAVGVFAVRASSLAQLASGYVRQSTQNQHVSEYGLLAVVTEMNTLRKDVYRQAMISTPNPGCHATQNAQNDFCYKFYVPDIQVNVSGTPLFSSPTTDESGLLVPGSLGPLPTMPLFAVEMFDPGPAARPTPGSDVGGTSGAKTRYEQVTVVSSGRVQPGSSLSCSDEAGRGAAAVAGSATTKAFLIIGPIQGN